MGYRRTVAVLCLATAAAIAETVVATGAGSSNPKRAGVCGVTASRPLPPGTATTIAFVRYQRGRYAIFTMPARGGPASRLTVPPAGIPPASENAFQDRPAWSPDGTRIAFASDRTGRFRIHVMHADGTHDRRITASKHGGEVSPSWSPDGRSIVFSNTADWSLYVVDSNGSGRRRLTVSNVVRDTDPAWSPDGAWIAFVRGESGVGSALFAIRPDGTGLCRLTPYAESVLEPSWSPRGTTIAYSTGNGSGFGIAVVGADGKGRRMLTPEGLDFAPAWSPDGREIAFSRSASLYAMRPDGSHVRRLTGGEIDDSPAWRPLPAR